jgi:hypothetical protein
MSYSVSGSGKTFEEAIAAAKKALEEIHPDVRPTQELIDTCVAAANSMVNAVREFTPANQHNVYSATFNGHVDAGMGGSNYGTSVASWYDAAMVEPKAK